MAFKPPPSREERLRQKESQEREAKAGMADYLKEQSAINENMARLRAMRLAKEAEAAEQAVEKAPRKAKAKTAVRRGVGSH